MFQPEMIKPIRGRDATPTTPDAKKKNTAIVGATSAPGPDCCYVAGHVVMANQMDAEQD